MAAAVMAGHWAPPQHLTWYWQLQGRVPLNEPVAAYDLDGFDTTAANVARLHAVGKRVICYVDVGTWERWRPDARRFPRGVLGRPVAGWPGERGLDLRRTAILEPLMTARLRMCARKGFDAVEGDNIDEQGNDPGFPVRLADQLRYAEWLAGEAHTLGLAVFQKNDPEQARALEPSFDGALVEQCNEYAECGAFAPYLRAGKPVINAEYRASLYPGFCAADARAGIMGALYDLSLDGRRFAPCWVA